MRGVLALLTLGAVTACGPTHPASSATASPTSVVPGVHELTETADIGSVTSLVVNGGAGNVTVTGGTGTTVGVTEHLYYSRAAPDATRTVSSSTLTVGYSCPIQVTCLVSYDIAVPRATAVKANTRAGAIRISDVTGSVTASAGAGNIHATGIASSAVSLTTLAGAVNASFTAAPDSVTARSHAGSITIQVPANVSYRITTQTIVGTTNVSVPRSDSSSHTITASTDVGGITISG
jgi:Putative adhesin